MTINRLEKPIIILAFGRSGTSIITDILLSHRDLAYISNYNAIAPKVTWIPLIRLVFDNTTYKIHGQKKQLNKVSLVNKYTFKNAEAYRYLNDTTQRNFGKSFLNKDILTDGEIKDIRRKFNQLVKLQFKSRLAFKTTGPSRLRFLHQIFSDFNTFF